MRPGVSTHVFLPQRLTPGLLDALRRAGATAIELFAARHHFDYTDRSAVRDLAAWFRDTATLPTLHQPLYPDSYWSRHVSPSLNLIDPDKSRRIEAMDEVKRALDAAEQIPFRSAVLHLGIKDDTWSPRSLENSLTAIEHLKAFAGPLGVQLLLENLQNDVTTPEHLLEILRVGHFSDVGICLDVGHAHLADPVTLPAQQDSAARTRSGLEHAFDLLQPRIAELHLHDNGGARDEHCWPGSAPNGKGINWIALHQLSAALPPDTPGVLEIAHEGNELPEAVTRQATAFFSAESRRAEQLHAIED